MKGSLGKQEVIGAVKWMMRTALLDTLCEADPRSALVRRLHDDLSALIEDGSLTFAEVECDADMTCAARIHFGDHYLVARGHIGEQGVEIARSLDCHWTS